MLRHRPATQACLYCFCISDINTEICMLPETDRVMKWFHVHLVAKRIPQSVLSDILTKSLHTEAI